METVQSLKTKYDLDFWPQNQQRSIWGHAHVWSIIIVCQKEMELSSKNGKTNCKNLKVQIWPWFLTPNRERSFSGHGQYICEVSLLYA